MKAKIKFGKIIPQLYHKEAYEPLLLECLNQISFFIEKSGGGFLAPISESDGQCDAIGLNGCYGIDFKLLLSQEGAQNVNDASLAEVSIFGGVTASQPSKAFKRGEYSLVFPNIWGFFVSNSFTQNENGEIVLRDKEDKLMEKTIKSLNKMICTKKNLLFFHPCSLCTQGSPCNIEEFYSDEVKYALQILSKARCKLSPENETYYALMVNADIILFSDEFEHIRRIELSCLSSWRKLHIKL